MQTDQTNLSSSDNDIIEEHLNKGKQIFEQNLDNYKKFIEQKSVPLLYVEDIKIYFSLIDAFYTGEYEFDSKIQWKIIHPIIENYINEIKKYNKFSPYIPLFYPFNLERTQEVTLAAKIYNLLQPSLFKFFILKATKTQCLNDCEYRPLLDTKVLYIDLLPKKLKCINYDLISQIEASGSEIASNNKEIGVGKFYLKNVEDSGLKELFDLIVRDLLIFNTIINNAKNDSQLKIAGQKIVVIQKLFDYLYKNLRELHPNCELNLINNKTRVSKVVGVSENLLDNVKEWAKNINNTDWENYLRYYNSLDFYQQLLYHKQVTISKAEKPKLNYDDKVNYLLSMNGNSLANLYRKFNQEWVEKIKASKKINEPTQNSQTYREKLDKEKVEIDNYFTYKS